MPEVEVIEILVPSVGTAAAQAAAAEAESAQAAAEAAQAAAELAAGPVDDVTVSGTSATVLDAWMGKLVRFTAATAVAVTMPATLPDGFNCLWVQEGNGQVTFSAGASATRKNAHSAFSSYGVDAVGSILVTNSTGTAAVCRVSGDLTA